MDSLFQITEMMHMEGPHQISAPGSIFTSPPVKCCCRMKAAVSRTVYVLNFSLAPLPPKGAGVTTLQSESVYLQAEHTQASARFPMELLQLFLSRVEEEKHVFIGGGCHYNLFLLFYTIYILKRKY